MRNNRKRIVESLIFHVVNGEQVAEDEDEAIRTAQQRTKSWHEKNTGAALQEAMFATAQMDRAAHRAAGHVTDQHAQSAASVKKKIGGVASRPPKRTASYEHRKKVMPARGSDLPWVSEPEPEPEPELVGAAVAAGGIGDRAAWERERAAFEAERAEMREEAVRPQSAVAPVICRAVLRDGM